MAKIIIQNPTREQITLGNNRYAKVAHTGNYDDLNNLPDLSKYADKTALDKKVDKVDGKDLSTNDFTDSDKAKLDGIETGAQVNKIEKIKVDGKDVTITDKGVSLDGGVKQLTPTAENISTYFDDILTPGIYKYNYSEYLEEYAENHNYGGILIVSCDDNSGLKRFYQYLINENGMKFRCIDGTSYTWESWTEYVKSNELTAKVRAVRPASATTIPTTLSANTVYDIGTQTAVSLKLPKGQLGDFIQVDFMTGSDAATVTVDATSCAISDFDLITETNTIYSLYFDWGVLGYDSTNSKYIYGWRFSDSEYTYSGGNT